MTKTKTNDPKTSVMQPNKLFYKMLSAYHQQAKVNRFAENHGHPIVGLDPGETTGYAYWNPQDSTFTLRQLKTKSPEEGYSNILNQMRQDLNYNFEGLEIVCEDYRVYAWKADTHSWAGLHTPQLIGAIKIMAMLQLLPLHFQMAQEAKSWATDDQLKSWGVYDPGQRHARDASRHIIRHMFFYTGKADTPEPEATK